MTRQRNSFRHDRTCFIAAQKWLGTVELAPISDGSTSRICILQTSKLKRILRHSRLLNNDPPLYIYNSGSLILDIEFHLHRFLHQGFYCESTIITPSAHRQCLISSDNTIGSFTHRICCCLDPPLFLVLEKYFGIQELKLYHHHFHLWSFNSLQSS